MSELGPGPRVGLVPVGAWVVYILLLLPSLVVIPISFGNPNYIKFPPDTFSLDLYRQFFGSVGWMDSIFMSLRIAIGAMVLALLVGVPAAHGLVRGAFRGRKLASIMLFSPILVPVVVSALGLYLYFSRIGILGTEFSLILGHAVYVLPFVVLTVMAGVRQIDARLEIAATIMGASELRSFWSVTLPLLRPSILAGGFFAFLMSFDEVVISYFIAKPSAMTLPVRMFSSIQWEVSPVIAAVSTILTLLSLIVCLVGSFTLKQKIGEVVS
jgi:putative spermidine/putrescine transport system permease protein